MLHLPSNKISSKKERHKSVYRESRTVRTKYIKKVSAANTVPKKVLITTPHCQTPGPVPGPGPAAHTHISIPGTRTHNKGSLSQKVRVIELKLQYIECLK